MSIPIVQKDYNQAQKSSALYNSYVPYDRRYSLETVMPAKKLDSPEKLKITPNASVNKHMSAGARSRDLSPYPDDSS